MEIVRVATSNNFNCTQSEWSQLNQYSKKYPDKYFFINSNINTPKLPTAANHPYKVVVTANPNLTQSEIPGIISRLMPVKSHIAFVRVKYIPNNKSINQLISTLINQDYPIVLTLQRFNGKKSLSQYTNIKYYKFSCSRYRLAGPELKRITNLVRDLQHAGYPVWICDQSGLGCQGCGLCSKLTTGHKFKISSLNLSTSGICPYHCPDCYAKTMQHFAVATKHRPIIFDEIKQNNKQSGHTAHIKRNLI